MNWTEIKNPPFPGVYLRYRFLSLFSLWVALWNIVRVLQDLVQHSSWNALHRMGAQQSLCGLVSMPLPLSFIGQSKKYVPWELNPWAARESSIFWISCLMPGKLYWLKVLTEEEKTNLEGVIKTLHSPKEMISRLCWEPINLHPEDKSNLMKWYKVSLERDTSQSSVVTAVLWSQTTLDLCQPRKDFQYILLKKITLLQVLTY